MTKDNQHILAQKIALAPHSAGVYRMLNAEGEVLYVGKAKNLKKRLQNYLKVDVLSNRIRKMVFETTDLILVETANEAEALLLEISLIKSLKPKYNVIFRDDTSYPYIHLSNHSFPRLTSYRGRKKQKGLSFGPYPDAKAMYHTMDMLERSFLLRTCKDSDFANRSRPCLKYHIKRCSAPCVGKVDKTSYKVLIQEAADFLNGKGQKIQTSLQRDMLQASKDMDFEKAAIYRDRLKAVAHVLSEQLAFGSALENGDVVALVQYNGQVAVQIFSYRHGQHVGDKLMPLQNTEGLEPTDILNQFVASHYSESLPPKEILTSHTLPDAKLLENILSQGQSLHIYTPQKGEKRQLVQKALDNAIKALDRQQMERSSWQKQLVNFAEILEVNKQINRIECFDISNIQGKHAVASLVVAGAEGMLKSDYRKFAIQGKDTPDDYAMMREVLMRRYSKLLKQSDEAKAKGFPTPPWPDVIMVDGGKGHLHVLEEVMTELGLNDEQGPILTAIAKGEFRDKGLETIFRSRQEKPLEIDYNSPLKFLLQVIRDESHRFAIGYHRQKRSKATVKSALDSIEGIGPKRKKALLLTFGSVEGVKGASVNDLMRVEGVSQALAEQIYNYFHAI